MKAIREKTNEIELWTRDNLVRRSDFQNAIDVFTRSVDGLRHDVSSNYRELNSKLDRIAQGMREDRASREQ